MYKLLIVDDEVSIIEGLSGFDWGSLGIELAGSCKNGLTALRWLEQNPVDIILSDIKMPIMDGLELANLVKQKYPFTYVLILSGYSDFELVRGSMKNGVFDYLLKPVQKEELIDTFQKLLVNLNQSKQQQSKTEMLERKARFATKYLRNDFLKQLLNSQLTAESIEEGCTYGELSFESEKITVCIFVLDIMADDRDYYSKEDWELILFAFNNILNELCEKNDLGYYWIDPQTGYCYLIVTNSEIQTSAGRLSGEMQTVKGALYTIDGLIRSTISCAIGTACSGTGGIFASAQAARAALKSGCAKDALFVYDKASNGLKEEHAVSRHAVSQPALPVDLSVDIGSKKHLLKKAVQFINENYMKSITLNEVAEQIYVNPVYLSNIFKEVIGINFIHYLTNLRIEEAKRLLKDPSRKIQEIGEAVGYENPRYFSKIFKKYASVTPYEFRNYFMEEE